LTEDLFFWGKATSDDAEPKLNIQPNSFTRWVLADQGQDQKVVSTFQRYTNDALTPLFSPDFTEVSFSIQRGNNEHASNIKISKGEESIFIWSLFERLIHQVSEELEDEESTINTTEIFNALEYVFIDDPVSSLDENHLIELAINLADWIKHIKSNLKVIITTHSPLFFNILYNELNIKSKGNRSSYFFERLEDGSFDLTQKMGDSNKSFSYHLHLMQTIEQAISNHKVERYHFTLLRNLYEKTANFLGYDRWSELLPDDKSLYLARILNFTSHSTLSNESFAEPTPEEKAIVKFLLDHLKRNYGYCRRESPIG